MWLCLIGSKEAVAKRPLRTADQSKSCSQVSMIFRPALRLLTRPFPLVDFAARFLAAVVLPPLLFFAICASLSLQLLATPGGPRSLAGHSSPL